MHSAQTIEMKPACSKSLNEKICIYIFIIIILIFMYLFNLLTLHFVSFILFIFILLYFIFFPLSLLVPCCTYVCSHLSGVPHLKKEKDKKT